MVDRYLFYIYGLAATATRRRQLPPPMKQFIYPSVIESHNSELRNVAPDLVHGVKIFDNGVGYIVGHLALSEGHSPHKGINSAPEDLDYQLLLKTGLLLASTVVDEPITLTVGFPYSTFQINRDQVAELVGKTQKITYDTSPYGGRSKQTRTIEISKVDVIPEVVGCIIGRRKGGRGQKGSFFMASLGYGTFEACLSTETGIVQRTMVSTIGVRYAVDIAMKEMMQKHYLGMRTEHQFDTAFHRGTITLNRRRIDLADIRTRALQRYYEDVISPMLRNTWTDDDFNRSSILLLAGGGSMYPELVKCFEDEFGGILTIDVVEDPTTLASTGYCIRSQSVAGEATGAAVGLDIGNAQTVLTITSENGTGWK